MWKGAISFGLVHVPVKMYSAIEEKDIAMKHIHQECGSSVSNVRNCPSCNREVAWEEVAKGYEYEKGKYVLFSKEELDQLLPDASKEIKILDFVNMNEIDPIFFQKTYYLSPDDTGSKAYNLLLHALKTTNKNAVCKVAIRSKESLGVLRVIGEGIALETIYYPDEVRPVEHVPNLPGQIEVDVKELLLAQRLVEQLSGPFDVSKYRDDYRNRLIKAIQKKIQGEDIRIQPSVKESNVMDLMAALQASLELYNTRTEETPKKKRRKKLKSVVEETA
jgi:DNA end-binding protein Ku